MRYSGPVKIRIEGDQEAGSSYIPLARTFLGQLHATYVEAYVSTTGKYSDSYASANRPQPTEFIARKLTLPNGVNIRVQYNTWMPMIVIEVPAGVGRAKFLEYRGLLRALQDASEPCEPLVPPTGEPGDEGYDPGEFSELHPLHNPNNVDEQWLVHSAGISTEHNGFPNHPLPPRGGTFIMDMIGVPFDQRAFNVRGKPPLTDCKMLVTGGGTTGREASAIDEPTFVWGDDDYIFNVPPKTFRIGRKDEMPGWPWLDTRDPANPIARLVSASAVFKAPYDWYKTYGDITIEFLKLNGEPFEITDDGYLEPIEIFVEDIWTDYIGFEDAFWYDFTVLSLTRRGNKAILGLNQAAYQWDRGICMDFIVLDLEAATAEEQVSFRPRYDFFVSTVSGYSESVGPSITNLAVVEIDSSYTESVPIAGRTYRRNKIRITDVYPNTPTDWFFPTSYNYSYSWAGEMTWHLYFDADESIVQCFYKNTGSFTYNRSQSLTTEAGEDGTTLAKFIDFPMHTTSSLASYVKGDIVYLQATLDGYVTINAYLCMQDHTGAFANRPGLTASRTDLNPSFWRFVYGKRYGTSGCAYQTWNGFTEVDPPPEDCEAYTPPFGSDQYGVVCGYLWLGTSRVFRPTVGTGNFRQRLDSLSGYYPSETHTLGKRVLGTTGADTTMLSMTYTNTWDTDSSELDSVDRHYCVNGYARSPIVADWWACRGGDWKASISTQSATFGGLSTSPTCSGGKPSLSMACTSLATNKSKASVSNSGGNDYVIFPSTYGVGSGGGGAPTEGPFYFGGSELSGFSTLIPFPVDGVGIIFAYGMRSICSRSGNCISNVSNRNHAWRDECYATAASGEASIDVPSYFSTSSGFVNWWVEPHEVQAMTDPMPFAPNADNDGLIFKPVIGPELSVLCDEQQISYVGWVYPPELKTNED